MKTRCDNPKSTQYPWYGGRGISYDPRWIEFRVFHEDMWVDWAEGLSIDRKDNELNYSKANCRWIPLSDQAKNRRPW